MAEVDCMYMAFAPRTPYLYLNSFCAGVGGIEAEAVMLGQAISMVLPQVVGYRLVGEINPLATSTDVVLTITKVI